MTKVFVPLLGLVLALALAGSFRPAAAAPSYVDTMLMATLSGAEEVPGPGDTDGAGTSTITLKPDTGETCWEINVSNITLPAAAAHIHEAPRGVAGGVVVPLSPPDANGMATGCVMAEAALMERIMNTPANFYVNVHTSDFPQGAVRGQLSMQGAGGGDTAGGDTPAALPNAGAADTMSLIAVLAALTLLLGLGISSRARRRMGAR